MACVASQGQQPGYQSHEPPSPPSAAPPPGPAAMPACAGSSSSSSSSCGLPPEEEAVLDRIIAELLSVKDARPGTEVHLAEEDILWVIRRCREVRGGPGGGMWVGRCTYVVNRRDGRGDRSSRHRGPYRAVYMVVGRRVGPWGAPAGGRVGLKALGLGGGGGGGVQGP